MDTLRAQHQAADLAVSTLRSTWPSSWMGSNACEKTQAHQTKGRALLESEFSAPGSDTALVPASRWVTGLCCPPPDLPGHGTVQAGGS